MSDKYQGFHVMESTGKGYGRVIWYNDEPKIAYLTDMDVYEPCRGKGLGNALQEHREQLAYDHGCEYVRLLVKNNSWMHEWYKRRGYATLEKHWDYPEWVWMIKKL